MTQPTLIRDLFVSDVTRDIPPVVYFHEQDPVKVAAEVSEYIITGGFPKNHPHHRRVPDGIHEQTVHLLTQIAKELDKPGGPDLPTAWISGFYGSGKSSFAKLLGLALDGMALPNGTSLAEAWLNRDTSPNAPELRQAWHTLRQKIDPIAVVFDIGGIARDNEHIHSAALRQVQKRLGYCTTEPLVADFELRLERDGHWSRFEQVAHQVLGKPWSQVLHNHLAEDDFSLVLSELFPDRYTDPMSWISSRGGTEARADSPDDAVRAIRDMLAFRRPGATLFLVVDEVSQYVLSHKDRIDRLRVFATALGATLRGKTWLLALGQQKLDEEAGDAFLVWAKDRFPPKLRVHLAPTNIHDVVHKRLLQKRPEAQSMLRALFEQHRANLKLYAYDCEDITPDDFADTYPMLPGHMDLILQITTALRNRSGRAQGDAQAIRGLLQLLGELFRARKLADLPIGALVTLDQVYEIQHTALDADVQSSMARVLHQCKDDAAGLLVRAAKVIALLELIQSETQPTTAKLVAQCLYGRVDQGNLVPQITLALAELRRRNLVSYSEKTGYKLQSSAAEEWERERRDIGVPREKISEIIANQLKLLLAEPALPQFKGRRFPWAAFYGADGRDLDNKPLVTASEEATFCIDFRFMPQQERTESAWVKKSAESALRDRLVWVSGDHDHTLDPLRDLYRSTMMVERNEPRRESLAPARKLLLQQEKNRRDDLETPVRNAVAGAWMAGKMYFRGRCLSPSDHGPSFAATIGVVATQLLPELYPHFVDIQIEPKELLQLVETDLTGPSTKFLSHALGILELDSGRYVPSCSGEVPVRILDRIEADGGVAGTYLLTQFGGPPYGYTANVIKASVAGLLRAGKIKVQPKEGLPITAPRDAGGRDLFDKDRNFRHATFFPAGEDDIGPQVRARIARFFADRLDIPQVDRQDDAIADAVAQRFPQLVDRLRSVFRQLNRLPGSPEGPPELGKLQQALESCLRNCRQTRPTVQQVKKHLDTLRDGVDLLRLIDAELTDDAVRAVTEAFGVWTYQGGQLKELRLGGTNVDVAMTRVHEQLFSDRPWRDIGAIAPDLVEIKNCYAAERTRLLQWQEHQAESARGRVKSRPGFSTLTADAAHRVLRPIHLAVTNTTAEAIAPTLAELKDSFVVRLHKAEQEANEILDDLLSEGTKPMIVRVELKLHNREITTEAEVDALVAEIKERLLEQVRAGVHVRLV
ncbi:MAG: BREX system P-loop protein BrxC [Myxococcales bacterium]|nr:BREX system P-loop protein BrxC [Myxococcales bacterium]